MYVPSSFVVEEQAILNKFILSNSFATLVSTVGIEPVASHLPLLLDETAGLRGTLIGHMAKANPQWQDAEGQTVLTIFHGPHAYISPGWYHERDVVPTWNYVAVHAYGVLKLVTEPEALVNIVRHSVDYYEASMPLPWNVDSLDSQLISRLAEGTVGVSIEIQRLEGKWKLSQNHSAERRRNVVDGLRRRNIGDDAETADLMEATIQD